MLSQSISTSRASRSPALREIQTAAIWGAIEATLVDARGATTREIAESIGLTPAAALARLSELRELGEVRFSAPREGSKLRTWEIGAEDFVLRAEQMTPTVVKAQQLGCYSRDPLVAALFGVPPAAGPFEGVNMDAIHHLAGG